jgi:CubicO group peptidase (beta-lactamase class C family)
MRFMPSLHTFVVICLSAVVSSTVMGEERAGTTYTQEVHERISTWNLDRAVAAGEEMPRLQSLLVSQRGRLVLERYFNGHGPGDLANVKSVSKSILSALVGIAIQQGYIRRVDAEIGGYFAAELASEPEPEKSKITVENLLTMQAGLRSTSNDNYREWISADNWVEAALAQPLETLPGTQMQYSTGDSHLLSAILTRATGRTTLEFARAVLAEPLDFTLSPWPRDPQGIYVGGNDMELTPRQLLAFGELYLNGGRAGGRQVVPAAWVEASLRPQAESPLGEDRYYGYGWWTCTLAGQTAPHAWGYGGQFVVLVPALDLVIVTTSSSDPDAAAHEHANEVYQLLHYIIESMSAASPSSEYYANGALARQ